ncbi:unnamed protein product [Durusdinium trenchii]|uniref:Uncharacterized protein n=1 Tax=Durusdinium trenchii TaxID=1381693 RepID=A0ABP0N0V0_9DINO
MAQNLRAKGLIPRAIRMMERALMITQRSELEHPSLALEACKVRLNFAAYLSEGYRHREALKVIKEAQENLMRLVHWALQCPPEDLAVQALGKEARALHCSAVVAEALDRAVALEFFEDDGKPPPDEMPEDLKGIKLGKWRVLKFHACEELTAPAADLPKPEPEKQKKRLDDRDVFKQYLRDREMARVAHLLALSDDWETQTRKKLEEVHRQAKFEMELVNVDELKEKRYSRLGHKVFMHQMRKMNRCWSDPTLSREARREKTAPEIHQLKKLSRKIYVKPPATQAPAPPPPKPKVDSSLAGSMKAMREEHA